MSDRSKQHFVGKDIDASRLLRILIFGAHPDDPDFAAGGVAALYTQQGHQARMVTVTNGDAGHHEMGGVPLAQRRRKEAAAAGACLGVEYITLDNHDCVLILTLEIRHQLVRIIREFQPDLVMTPRPCDYHPDHRYTSQLVQDAVCTASVPNIVSDVPYLHFTPVVVYVWDDFQKPYPFIPDVVVSIDNVIEKKVDAFHCHVSQMYEFLPFIKRYLDKVPEDPSQRRAWLWESLEPRLSRVADLYRDRLIELYGKEKGKQIKYAEAFESCEYGAPLSEANLKRLFPFF
jgi:LmbE family N-acetylglucosaminyl deacetylase